MIELAPGPGLRARAQETAWVASIPGMVIRSPDGRAGNFSSKVCTLVALRTTGHLRLISDLRSEHRAGRRDFVLGSGPMATMLCDMAVPGPMAGCSI